MKKLLLIFTLFSFFAEAQTISSLPAASTITGTELVPIVQSGNKKATVQQLLAVPTTYVTQTGNYTLTDYTATDGVCKDWVIRGNGTNAITVPALNATDGTAKWINGNGNSLENTKVNYIYTCAKNGHIIYNTIKTAIPTADVTSPIVSSAVTNPAGTQVIVTYGEPLDNTVTFSNSDFTLSPSKTITGVSVSGSTITVTVSSAFVLGNTITITGGANKIKDATGNISVNLSSYPVTNNAGDVVAPTYSIQTVTGVSNSTATFNVRLNEAGTVRWIVTSTATSPSKPAIDAGTGAVVSNFGPINVLANTTSTASISGLTANTTYYLHSYSFDAALNQTAVQTAISFTTTNSTFVLDNTVAARAYSVRKLKADYNGPCLKVRRSSDNSELDIGFVSNELDVTAFNTFVGAGQGYVTTWYDQSGIGQNATQTAISDQPQLIVSGINSKPTLVFDGTNDKLTFASQWVGNQARSLFAVFKNTRSNAPAFIGDVAGEWNTAKTNGSFFMLQTRNLDATGHPYLAGFAQDLTDNTAPNTTSTLASAHHDGTTAYLRRNGTQIASGAKTFTSTNSGLIGGLANITVGESNYQGQISEVIVCASHVSASLAEVETRINSYYSLY